MLLILISVAIFAGVLSYYACIDQVQRRSVVIIYSSVGLVLFVWIFSLGFLRVNKKELALLVFISSSLFIFVWIALYVVAFHLYIPTFSFSPSFMKIDNVNSQLARPVGCSSDSLSFRIEKWNFSVVDSPFSTPSNSTLSCTFDANNDNINLNLLPQTLCDDKKLRNVSELRGYYSIWITCERFIFSSKELQSETVNLYLPNESVPSKIDQSQIRSDTALFNAIFVAVPLSFLYLVLLSLTRWAIQPRKMDKFNDTLVRTF